VSEAPSSLFSDIPQKLMGHRIAAVSVVSDDFGVTAIHLLGQDGLAVKIEAGDPGYLAVGEYVGWASHAWPPLHLLRRALREDWTRITSPCGMHGEACPAVYAPCNCPEAGTSGTCPMHDAFAGSGSWT
jgi:hypothetical protein